MMNYHKFILFFASFSMFAIFLVGCTSSNEQWIIFTQRRAEQMGIGSWISSDGELDGYWTPSAENIQSLEGDLASFLRQNADSFRRQPPVWEQLDQYKRQYVGVIIGGKQVIYGNFFCTETGVDWREDWVLVMDGGDCFFQIQFDVENGTFTSLTVNGEA